MIPPNSRILVIRRDNIGDLVCTLPLLSALRRQFPSAYLAVLVNSYNRAVLTNYPDIDDVFFYTKGKHRQNQNIRSMIFERGRLLWKLRGISFDYVILAGSGFQKHALRWATLINARNIVGFCDPKKKGSKRINMGVEYHSNIEMHEVETVFRLGEPLGVKRVPHEITIQPEKTIRERLAERLSLKNLGLRYVGMHISARKISNQWPAQKFIQLINSLSLRSKIHILLFWSPGAADNPLHPGDDEKAAAIQKAVDSKLITPIPTQYLEELIAGLSLSNVVICSDGGAMHLASALGKPIVALFGETNAKQWHPWGVPYKLIQNENCDVSNIDVHSVLQALDYLEEKLKK